MSQDLSTRFKNALNYIKNAPADVEISNAMKLKFYGLFKQATDGPCNSKIIFTN